jgi:hypothetical protein
MPALKNNKKQQKSTKIVAWCAFIIGHGGFTVLSSSDRGKIALPVAGATGNDVRKGGACKATYPQANAVAKNPSRRRSR